MTKIQNQALPTEIARGYQDGGVDAHGAPPERGISDGGRIPCRHCLADIPSGEEYLLLAHRPFGPSQPFAETGPIFLCAKACERFAPRDELPPVLKRARNVIIRGYSADERIVYSTAAMVPVAELSARAAAILEDATVASVHVRAATTTCYLCRIERAGE
jgi:hypothetical protein